MKNYNIPRTYWIPQSGVYIDRNAQLLVIHKATIELNKETNRLHTALYIQSRESLMIKLELDIFSKKPENFFEYIGEL